MKKKSIVNVYIFMGLIITLIALLGNFLAKEYFVFLGIFITTDYMMLFLSFLIISLLVLSVFILTYKLSRIKLFIGNSLRHYKKIIYLKTNIIIGLIGANALFNSIVGFIIRDDLVRALPKIHGALINFESGDLFVGYIVKNILIFIVAAALLVNINKKEE